jgi:hypothetical protein
VTPEGRTPPLFIIVTVVLLGFALLSSVQAAASGFLLGWASAETSVRLWASGIIWVGDATAFLIFASLLASDGSTVLRRIRITAAVADVCALAVLVWLASVGRMEPIMLGVGAGMVVVGWSGSIWVCALRSPSLEGAGHGDS